MISIIDKSFYLVFLVKLNVQMFSHVFQQIGSWLKTHELLLDLLSIHESNHGWQSLNFQVFDNIGAFICIDFHNLNLSFVLLRDLVQNWCQCLAWSTPVSIDINENWNCCTLDLFIELSGILDVDDTCG